MKRIDPNEFDFHIGPQGKLRAQLENIAISAQDADTKRQLGKYMDELWSAVSEQEKEYDRVLALVEEDLLPSLITRYQEDLEDLRSSGMYRQEYGRSVPNERAGNIEDNINPIIEALSEIHAALSMQDAELPDVAWLADEDGDLRSLVAALEPIRAYQDSVADELQALHLLHDRISRLDQASESGSEQ
jgi:hypothetical protein